LLTTFSPVAALLSPLVLIPIFTLIFGLDHYDWKSMVAIRKADDDGDLIDEIPASTSEGLVENDTETPIAFQTEQKNLKRAGKISKLMTVVMTIALLVIWPFPMYGSSYIFSKPFFTGWVTVGIIWIFCSLGAVGVYPIYEGRATLFRTVKAIYFDLTNKKAQKTVGVESAIHTSVKGVNEKSKSLDNGEAALV
jgi:urea-proton symporter